MDNKKAPEGEQEAKDLNNRTLEDSFSRTYEGKEGFTFEIKATRNSNNSTNINAALREFASCSHNFYLELAGEIGKQAKPSEKMNYRLGLDEQILLLDEWNKKHIETEPEQARKNIETMCQVINLVKTFSGRTW